MNLIPITGDFSANLVFSVIGSTLIPALVLKLIFSFFFQRNIGYLKLLAGLIGAMLLGFGIAYALGLQSQAAYRALSQYSTLAISAGTLLSQALVLFAVVTDDIGQRIPFWQWIVALIIQYVLYTAFAYLLALALSV